MEIGHLREFVKAANEGSFTRAAAALHTTQPAISRHIAELEHELGVQLLLRNNRRTALTEEGTFFYEDALRILQDHDIALEKLAAFKRSPLYSLTIAAFVGYKPTDDLLLALQAEARKTMRRLTLTVHDITVASPLDELLAGQIDVALMPVPPACAAPDLCRTPLIRDELVAIVEDGHPLAATNSIAMADIGSDVVWTFRDGITGTLYGDIEQRLLANGATPRFMPHPWSNTRKLYDSLPFFEGGIHINRLNAVRYSMPVTLRGHTVLRFTDSAAQDTVDALWLPETSNPAVPWAIQELRAAAASMEVGVR